MVSRLRNNNWSVEISDMGAELSSIRSRDGREYIWQAGNDALTVRAPILFPFVSWMYDSSYRYNGKVYQIPFLGFAHNREFEIEKQTDESIVYRLDSSSETMAMYPFRFTLRIHFRLEGDRLKVVLSVKNLDNKTMYFSLGWHPTFIVPLEDGLLFDDYSFVFGESCHPLRIMREKGRYLGDQVAFSLEDDKILRLNDEKLEKEGVIVLRDMAKSVTLSSARGQHGVEVSYPDMRLFVIFHRKGIPFITTEAWTSFMGRNGVIEDISGQPDLVPLSAGNEYLNKWQIRCF